MMTPINPASLGAPKGYSNGMLAPPGARLLFIAGQVAWDAEQRFLSQDFAEQFEQALRNILAVLQEAGGSPEDIGFLRIYVLDTQEYRDAEKRVGQAYRKLMGRHYPAMALLEVKGLLEQGARLELEALAALSAPV